MRRLLKQVEELAQYPVIKNQWLELYDELHKFRLHLSRKQNQLYSILERKGFDRPTTTMWLLDDFIRDEIRDARRLLEENKDDEFIAMQPTVVADVLDLMQKEETVLYPTSLAMIRPAEFEEMKSGDREIGFAWIQVAKKLLRLILRRKPYPLQLLQALPTNSPAYSANMASAEGAHLVHFLKSPRVR